MRVYYICFGSNEACHLHGLSKICNNLLQLIEFTVTGRFQYVEYNGYVWFYIKISIVKDSNLWPLLFIMCFNDVVSYIKSDKLIFANDSKIARVIETSLYCLFRKRYWKFGYIVSNRVSLYRHLVITFFRNILSVNYLYNIGGTSI